MRLESEDPRTQELTAENARLLERIRDLEKENGRLLTVREEVAAPKPAAEPLAPETADPPEAATGVIFDDARFADAIARHLEHERAGMHEYIREMHEHSPYRTNDAT